VPDPVQPALRELEPYQSNGPRFRAFCSTPRPLGAVGESKANEKSGCIIGLGICRCDCYVVDQKTSATSALNLIAQLRDRHLTAPAILITSHPSLSLRQQAEKAEVPIVEKPLVGNALLDKIRDVVGARG